MRVTSSTLIGKMLFAQMRRNWEFIRARGQLTISSPCLLRSVAKETRIPLGADPGGPARAQEPDADGGYGYALLLCNFPRRSPLHLEL
jgi:hypothetical protein